MQGDHFETKRRKDLRNNCWYLPLKSWWALRGVGRIPEMENQITWSPGKSWAEKLQNSKITWLWMVRCSFPFSETWGTHGWFWFSGCLGCGTLHWLYSHIPLGFSCLLFLTRTVSNRMVPEIVAHWRLRQWSFAAPVSFLPLNGRYTRVTDPKNRDLIMWKGGVLLKRNCPQGWEVTTSEQFLSRVAVRS